MIDASMFNLEKLIAAFLNDSFGNVDMWRKHATIIPNYMPPFRREDTKPKCVVAFEHKDGKLSFLRYSCGPGRSQFWDMYGDDYMTPELAFMGLLEAPVPPNLQPEWLWNKNREAMENKDSIASKIDSRFVKR